MSNSSVSVETRSSATDQRSDTNLQLILTTDIVHAQYVVKFRRPLLAADYISDANLLLKSRLATEMTVSNS